MKMDVNLEKKTMIKKFINAYRNKIIKIYRRYGLLFRDCLGLGLGEPYSTIKMVLSLKNIYI